MYHVCVRLRVSGPLDREALQRALDRIVARHEALRTRFAVVDGQPLQVIDGVDCGLGLAVNNLRQTANRETDLRRILDEETGAAFDFERGPLIRAGLLVVLGPEEHVLLMTMHHIVSDGWSVGVLVEELGVLYEAYRTGEEDPLPPLSIQYADYAAWQRERLGGAALRRQAAYWKETLSGAPAQLQLPWDRARPAEQEYAGDSVEVVLGADLSRGLRALSRRHGNTLLHDPARGLGRAAAAGCRAKKRW